jgi:hypothetical protein
METKQTAVDWLHKELINSKPNINEWYKIYNEAKQMEKEQLIDFGKHGFTEGTIFGMSPIVYKFISSEQYYNETYENN